MRVTSTDGVSLAVAESGDPGGPTVLCVHGYPDNRSVWEPVSALLGDRYRVITYDTRGAGESGRPANRRAYHLDRLSDDLAAVIDALSPDRPVHLLAHDWGSIQAWHAVTDARLRPRIASFTSISGPCLDHAGFWLRSRLRRHGWRELMDQLLHSFYILFFQLPVLPELAWRTGAAARVMRRLDPSAPVPALPDGLHGLALYRQNMLPRLFRPRPRYTDVPVQVLAPTEDAFVRVSLQTGIGHWASDLRVRSIQAGHWVLSSAPEVIARHATELIDAVEPMSSDDSPGLYLRTDDG